MDSILVKQALIGLVGLVVVSLGVGCGSDDVGEDDSNQWTDEASGWGDCAEDEQVNPITGRCIAVPEGEEPEEQDEDEGSEEPDEEEDSEEPDVPDCEEFDVEVKACVPSGEAWPFAQVTVEGVDCDGDSYQRQVDATLEGEVVLEDMSPGKWEVTVSSGPARTELSVDVEGAIDDGELHWCLASEDYQVAVLSGLYEDTPSRLDSMGIEYEEYNNGSTLLMDREALSQYDAVVIECQATTGISNSTVAVANLEEFHQKGGYILMTDNEREWMMSLAGDHIDFAPQPLDNGFNLASTGQQGMTVEADSAMMVDALGDGTVDYMPPGGGFGFIEWMDPLAVTSLMTGLDIDLIDFSATSWPLDDPLSDYYPGLVVDEAPLIVSVQAQAEFGRIAYSSLHIGGYGDSDEQRQIVDRLLLLHY